MALRTSSLVVLAATLLVLACGCGHGAATLPELNEQQRANARLPASTTLTLATETDISNATIASATVKDAVEHYLSIRGKHAAWKIGAARVVGEYMLLWIGFPEVLDGGIDLIYSSKEQGIVGTFLGDLRG